MFYFHNILSTSIDIDRPVSVLHIHWPELCVFFFEIRIFFSVTLEGTYKFVEENKTQSVCFVFITGAGEHTEV